MSPFFSYAYPPVIKRGNGNSPGHLGLPEAIFWEYPHVNQHSYFSAMHRKKHRDFPY